MLNRYFAYQISYGIAIIVACAIIYYFLIIDNIFHLSISSIISYTQDLAITQHLLIMGLLPIYIATTVFGTAYVAFLLQQFLFRLVCKS